MTNVTIKNGSTTFTFADGEVKTVEVQKQGRLDENTMPSSDSDGTFIVDFQGVMKTITLDGTLYDTTGSSRTDIGTTVTIEEQIAWLLLLVNGTQSGYIFNSTYQTNKKVYVRGITTSEKAGDPLQVTIKIDMVEGF